MAHHPPHTLQVVARGAPHVDARVGVVDPVDRYFLDPQAGPLGEHEELGVEEPGVVLDVRQERARGVGAHRLEAALRVTEVRVQRGVQQAGCTHGRSPPAAGPARRVRRAPGEIRSRRRCAPTRRRRRAAGARRDRSTGRRPCTRRRRRRSRTRPVAARGRVPSRRGGRPRHRRATRQSDRATVHVSSVLALSAIVIRHANGNRSVEVPMQPGDARGEHVRFVEHRDDDLDEWELARSRFVVLVTGPLGQRRRSSWADLRTPTPRER